MNRALRDILIYLMNKRYIGGSHTPEKKLITSKTKWLESKEKKMFEKEYKAILNKGIILRQKKKTGKSLDYHISLNPKKLKEVSKILAL